jgi:hypothetical protein
MLVYRTILAIAAVALSAAAVLALPGFSPEVEASAAPIVQKTDRLDYRPLGMACSEQAWPYYEAKCLRDRTQEGGQPRPARIVKVDRTK